MGASPTIHDASQTEFFVCFIPELLIARMLENPQYLKNPDRLRFVLTPTRGMLTLLGERAKNDKRYNPREDCFVIDVPKEYIYEPPNQSPVVFRYGILTNWEGQYVDIMNGITDKLMRELQSVRISRDHAAETVKHKDRQVGRMAAHPEAFEKEIIKKYAKTMTDMNPVVQTAKETGGNPK